MSGSVRAAEQDSSWEGTLGAGWAFLAVFLSAVNLSEFNSQVFTNTHLLVLYLSAHLKHTLLHVLSIVFYLSLWFFLFAVSFFLFSSLTTIIMLRPAPHLSSCRPLLLPSILQMLVGSRTISRGSRWPAAPSLWSLPAIVPGSTAAWLLHSINRTHTGLIPTALCSALASIMGENTGDLSTCIKAGYLGEICGKFHPGIE